MGCFCTAPSVPAEENQRMPTGPRIDLTNQFLIAMPGMAIRNWLVRSMREPEGMPAILFPAPRRGPLSGAPNSRL